MDGDRTEFDRRRKVIPPASVKADLGNLSTSLKPERFWRTKYYGFYSQSLQQQFNDWWKNLRRCNPNIHMCLIANRQGFYPHGTIPPGFKRWDNRWRHEFQLGNVNFNMRVKIVDGTGSKRMFVFQQRANGNGNAHPVFPPAE